jgi:hypothetical protein
MFLLGGVKVKRFQEDYDKSICPRTGKPIKSKTKRRWLIWIFPVVGLLALIWTLIRIIPKPSRAAYPCQRVALPLASSFIVWLMGLGGSAAVFRRAKNHFSHSRYISGLLCVAVSIGCIWLCLTFNTDKQTKAAGSSPANSPIGVARGIYPGRVVWVHDPNATTWNGPGTGDGYWWQSNHTNQQDVNSMVKRAICALAGQANISNAWDALIRNFNQTHGRGDVGYTIGEKIMIKVNFVDMIAVGVNDGSPPAINYNFTSHRPDYPICSPQIIHALLDQLVNVVGVSQSDITIGDPTCLWCNEFYNMIHPDFPNVRYLDYLGWYNRTQAVKSTVPFYWSTTHANGKLQDYAIQSYVDAEYFINLPNLKSHHNVAGITVCGKNHYGSLRGPTTNRTLYYDMHMDGPFFTPNPQEGRYRPMVDLMGHRDLGGKTLLCLVDGLYAGKHGSLAYPIKWQTTPFYNDWPSSIFASQDQVAMDSVAFDFLVTEWPEATGPGHEGTDDYLHEAAEANNPASGTFYDPERDGTRLSSLGVHEHWNNSTSKQYTRNLGTGNGIELVKVSLTPDVDYNVDGKVNFEDFATFAQYWHQASLLADIAPQPVPDGVVDFKDLFVFCENWLIATKTPPLPSQASSASPINGASGISTDANLSWTAGTDAESHDVYFGTINPPPFIGNQTGTAFDPGTLAQSKTYYWRIDEINGWGLTTGGIWQFSTSAPGLSDTTDDMTGTVTAQGQNLPSGEGAAQAFDNSTSTKWLDFSFKPSNISWIRYQYASSKTSVVTEYTITSANDAQERDPMDWNLQGSNTGGSSWVTLDTKTGELFTARFQKRLFLFTNSTAYNIYRLYITKVRDNAAANSVQLAEIELIGTAPQ